MVIEARNSCVSIYPVALSLRRCRAPELTRSRFNGCAEGHHSEQFVDRSAPRRRGGPAPLAERPVGRRSDDEVVKGDGMSGGSLSEGRRDLPEAGQANRHRLRAHVESLRELSDRLFDIRILPELFDTRPQQSFWHQQGSGELVRLDLIGIARAAGLGVPDSMFHFRRIRCSTSAGFDVPLPPDSMFHFRRIRCSTSAGIRRMAPCHGAR